MRHIRTLLVASTVAAFTVAPGAEAQTEAKCSPDRLSRALYERMGKEGKSDAEIREILDSSFKRRVLRGRVADGSGCTAEQTDKALDDLAVRVKQG